jgi:hypothetical protein
MMFLSQLAIPTLIKVISGGSRTDGNLNTRNHDRDIPTMTPPPMHIRVATLVSLGSIKVYKLYAINLGCQSMLTPAILSSCHDMSSEWAVISAVR